MRRALYAQPLTSEAFAPFGEVIKADDTKAIAINAGTSTRFHDLATIDVGGNRLLVSIFRAQPQAPPIVIRMLERHPLGTQAFVPLQPCQWLVVVAPPGDEPTFESLIAFNADGSQGVNYFRDVWHHPLLVVGLVSDFLIIDREGEADNLNEFRFDRELEVRPMR